MIKTNIPKVGVVSLGCSKNTVDTEFLLGGLCECGFNIENDPSECDIIIVNTCGFIEPAKQESINTILEMAEYKEKNCSCLIVTGCLSQRYREELIVELPEVDMFFGVHEYESLCEQLSEKFLKKTHCCGDITERKRVLTTPDFSAYLRIADGCRNNCTYCAIPIIRGTMRSVPEEKVLFEAERLAKSGVTELNVIAQDTSAYGIDLYNELRLPKLLNAVSKISGIHSVRLLYTYPDTVTDELIATISENEKIANYIDIPIQHISNRILFSMNRRGSRADIERIIKKIRQTKDDFIIRTSIIVGFPGETDEDFNELLSFLSDNPIDRVGAFTYSAEDGTKASDFSCQIEEEVKQERLDRLMSMQMNISKSLSKKRIGTETEVLIESVSVDCDKAEGRSYAEAPDVDGSVFVDISKAKGCILPGDYIKAKITSATEYDLYGELL